MRFYYQEFHGNVPFIYDSIAYYVYSVTIDIKGKTIARRLGSNIKSKRTTKAYIILLQLKIQTKI